MMKLFYPCKIRKEEGIYYAEFIDFPDCFTDGETMEELVMNASDVLEGVAFSYLKNNMSLPEPSLEAKDVVFIELWIDLIKDKVNNRSVKKTLTIPKWLNDLAEENKINFSAVLQLGIKDALGIRTIEMPPSIPVAIKRSRKTQYQQ